MIAYSWKSSRSYLTLVFAMGTGLSIYAGVIIPLSSGGDFILSIILMIPFVMWIVSYYPYRYVAMIRLFVKSGRMARTLMASLAGASESERAKILKSSPATGEIPETRTSSEVDSSSAIHEPEADATSSIPGDNIELTQPAQARLRANVRSSSMDDQLDENDLRFRRADTEWNMGR